MDKTLIAFALVLLAAAAAIFEIVRSELQTRRTAKLRLLWRRKIEQIADDLATDPNGWSLDDLMNCLGEPEWEEICRELEKMPAGKRSLQKAIEICNRSDSK